MHYNVVVGYIVQSPFKLSQFKCLMNCIPKQTNCLPAVLLWISEECTTHISVTKDLRQQIMTIKSALWWCSLTISVSGPAKHTCVPSGEALYFSTVPKSRPAGVT